MQYMSLDLKLPWAIDQEQESIFQRLLKIVFFPLIILFLIIPWLPVFDPEYIEPKEKMIKTKVLLDPPKYEKPEPLPKVKPKKIKPKIEKKAKNKGTMGLASLSKSLSSLRGTVDVKRMQNKNVSDNTTGKVTKNSRTVLGRDNAVRSSGGINVDKNAMLSQSTILASHKSSEINVPTGTSAYGKKRKRSYSSNIEGNRDLESIRTTLEKEKGHVYALYHSALRKFPDLSGKFLFKLVIEADGSISDLRLVSSELGLEELEQNILDRIRGINFGAADVSATTLQYKFVFLPS